MKRFSHITTALFATLLCVAAVAASMHGTYRYSTGLAAEEDTIVPFGVRHPGDPVKMEKQQTGDLHDPDNVKTGMFYDEKTGTYRYGTQFVGGQSGTAAEGKGGNATASASGAFLYVPFFMTYEDYETWAVQQSMQQYFKKKNAEIICSLSRKWCQ